MSNQSDGRLISRLSDGSGGDSPGEPNTTKTTPDLFLDAISSYEERQGLKAMTMGERWGLEHGWNAAIDAAALFHDKEAYKADMIGVYTRAEDHKRYAAWIREMKR